MRSRKRSWLSLCWLLVTGCEAASALEPSMTSAALSVAEQTADAFSLPMPGLTPAQLAQFFVGNSFFNQNWVAAPASVSERDGLGPLFNARSCSGCHFKDGRGRPPEHGQPARSMILRIGLAAAGGTRAHPMYGDQLQTDALPGVPVEAALAVSYEQRAGRYTDGEPYQLRVPHYRLAQEGYGPLPSDLLISARVAPATIGLGLLEAVPERAIMALADAEDRDGDGISGRPQRVANAQGALQLGRFGWKAEQPSVRAQVLGAFAADMGITSALFRGENHSAAQAPRAARPSGGDPELSAATERAVVAYMRTLAVPRARGGDRGELRRGRALFERAGCPACHTPSLRTGRVVDLPVLSEQTFFPYTDLLLHDLGEELSDHRPVHAARGGEWRTAPLWGIGLFSKVNGHQLLLHDGRARGVAEAVLFHGGEGARARRAFREMSRAERAQLVSFVESL